MNAWMSLTDAYGGKYTVASWLRPGADVDLGQREYVATERRHERHQLHPVLRPERRRQLLRRERGHRDHRDVAGAIDRDACDRGMRRVGGGLCRGRGHDRYELAVGREVLNAKHERDSASENAGTADSLQEQKFQAACSWTTVTGTHACAPVTPRGFLSCTYHSLERRC